MSPPALSEMNTGQLLDFLDTGDLDERQAIAVLRNPFCTAEVARKLMERKQGLSAHRVRELLCRIRGMPLPLVIDLISTLPWISLLHLAQDAGTPPLIRRRAEQRLLQRLPRLTLGEKTALARRAHRELFLALFDTGEVQIIEALLENPRMTESDLLRVMLRLEPPPDFFAALIRHPKWACRRDLRRALARHAGTPLPLALSALAELGLHELEEIRSDRVVPEQVRDAAAGLILRRKAGGTDGSKRRTG